MIRIGHRGACGYELENTISSFQKALDLNVDVIEFDLRKCKSGELIVIHDKTWDRTTNAVGLVSNTTFAEIKAIQHINGDPILRFEELLDFIDRRAKVNIEIKDEGIEHEVVRIIKHYTANRNWDFDDFLVSSFNHYQIKTIAEQNQSIRVGALMEGLPVSFDSCFAGIPLYSAHLCHDYINAQFVEQAHAAGAKVYVWTVNETEDIECMSLLGVDGIISNFPDRVEKT